MPVFCKKEGNQLWVHSFVRTEVSTQEAAYQLSIDGRIVSWEMYVFEASEDALKIFSQFLYLGGLSSTVQTLKYYQHDRVFLNYPTNIVILLYETEPTYRHYGHSQSD